MVKAAWSGTNMAAYETGKLMLGLGLIKVGILGFACVGGGMLSLCCSHCQPRFGLLRGMMAGALVLRISSTFIMPFRVAVDISFKPVVTFPISLQK
jgi:hypothetical protein